jgi:hypothetical protein
MGGGWGCRSEDTGAADGAVLPGSTALPPGLGVGLEQTNLLGDVAGLGARSRTKAL